MSPAPSHWGLSRKGWLSAPSFGTGDVKESWLGVPILGGDRVIGVLWSKARPNAFTDADEHCFRPSPSSMGVALENARLFDETKHLLSETEQRNAELAVINEISAALSKKLDFNAIVDAVGDKLSEVLGSQDMTIAILDEETGQINIPYWTEDGVRDRNVRHGVGRGPDCAHHDFRRAPRLGNFRRGGGPRRNPRWQPGRRYKSHSSACLSLAVTG